MKAPPLSLRPSVLLEGQPTPENIADRLARIGHNADPQHRLAKYIATSAMGIGNSRPLSQQEAMDALSIILEGDADPIQIGALLATMQYRGVTAAELAGFIEAMWGHIKETSKRPHRSISTGRPICRPNIAMHPGSCIPRVSFPWRDIASCYTAMWAGRKWR